MEEQDKMDKEFNEIKIDNIKRFVDTQLEDLGLYDKIKNYIDVNIDDNDEETIMNKIKEGGLIDEILESFKNVGMDSKKNVDNSKKCLYLKLIKAQGFIDYANQGEDAHFQFDILFLGQRFQSKKMTCSPDFFIDQSFILEFNPLKLDIDIDFERLRKLSCPIHLVLLLIEGDERKLVATKSLEWRWALCYGSWKIDAEMYSPATLNKLNVGSVEVNIVVYLLIRFKSLCYRLLKNQNYSQKKLYLTI